MHPILFASEGGYQNQLSSNDKLILWGVIACGVIGILTAVVLIRGVLAADEGSGQDARDRQGDPGGRGGFLKRQFRTIGIIIVPLAVLIFFTATKVVRPDGSVAMSFAQTGIWRVGVLPLRCSAWGSRASSA